MKLFLLIVFGVADILAQRPKVFQDFLDGNTQFTAAVFKEMLKSNSGNFLVCPLSAQLSLALAHAGARTNTAKEIVTGLHLPEDRARIDSIFINLAPMLRAYNEYNLTIANKIYLADVLKINDEYNATASNVFGAGPEKINFVEKEQATSEINRWVEERTHDKIKNLISPNDLSPDTLAVLVNAVYLKAEWVTQFHPDLTIRTPFFVSSTKKIEAEMMRTSEHFNYYDSQELNAQFLQLPYKGDDITMTIVLPRDNNGLPALEARIAEILIEPQYKQVKVDVSIPKYKIEANIHLKPVLQALGIKDAFTSSADFTGISSVDGKSLYIKDMIQKSFIEVNEQGTTAAASSAVFIGNKNIVENRFIADHPFIFYLRHKISGILFIGRFSMP